MYDYNLLGYSSIYDEYGNRNSDRITFDKPSNDVSDEPRHIKLQLLPKRTNFLNVPEEYRHKNTTENMSYEEKQPIIDVNNKEYTKLQYERMKIKLISDYDSLVYQVELPSNWQMKKVDSYWTNVLDDKNRIRICYFRKTNLYDNDAFSDFYCRYGFDIVPFDNWKTDASYEERKSKPWRLIIQDCQEEFKLLKTFIPKTSKEYLDMDNILRPIAIEYLNTHYPDWKNINAYWD